MSFKAVLWALDQQLPANAKLLLVALASHASLVDGSCYPRVRTIADKASISTRTVHRILPLLEGGGHVRVERKFRGKARLPSKYWLSCPCQERDVKRNRDTRGYDSHGGPKNHYLNHNLARQHQPIRGGGSAGRREGLISTEQAINQQAQVELARRLGREGWEILSRVEDEVPALCRRLLAGKLTSEDLDDLKQRFLRDKEQGQ